MLVVDASAVIELLLGTRRGRAVMEAMETSETLHAPDILGVEIVSALRKLVRVAGLSGEAAEHALHTLDALGIEMYDPAPFLARMLQLSDTLTAYDASYVALAEVLDAPVLTCDKPMAASHGHRAAIRLVDE